MSEANKFIRQFWPYKGPVWDGLAVVTGKNGEKGLVLVEAKSYPAETISKMKANSDISKALITSSIEMTKKAFGSTNSLETWLNRYYQLANRLCFLTLLNIELNIPTWLLLVNFTDDQKHKSTGLTDWKNHYSEVFDTLKIQADAPLTNKVVPIFLPATT